MSRRQHFYHTRDGEPIWPERTLGDMNRLPYANEIFDIVLFSAALHHSPDTLTMCEVARILKPDGIALVLSEQIGGWFKSTTRYNHRNQLIHESYFYRSRYDSAFRAAGFTPKYLFSAFYDRKLRQGKFTTIRDMPSWAKCCRSFGDCLLSAA